MVGGIGFIAGGGDKGNTGSLRYKGNVILKKGIAVMGAGIRPHADADDNRFIVGNRTVKNILDTQKKIGRFV